MTATYDLGTDVGKARLFSKDTALASPRFTDEEITEFLTMEGGDPRLAAAVSLEITATNAALMAKVAKIEGIELGSIAMSDALITQANNLRKLVRLSASSRITLDGVKRTDSHPLI